MSELRGKHTENIQIPQPDGTTKPPAPAEKDNKRAVTHGAYSFLTSGIIPCNKCLIRDDCKEFEEDKSCKIIEAFQVEKVGEIMDLPYIKPEDVTLAQMLARELAFQAVVAKYIAKVGLFKPERIRTRKELDLQPVLKSYWISVNAATRMCSELGLSPVARAKLKIGDSAFDLAKALSESEAEDAK